MPRIRTVKPELFRHRDLQELAKKHGAETILVYIGLWTQCDRAGNFRWDDDQLSLDILPFLGVDIRKSLEVLGRHGYVLGYTSEGKKYGHIPTFSTHQLIFGSEAKYPPKFPEYNALGAQEVLGSPRKSLDHGSYGDKDNRKDGNKDKGKAAASPPSDPLFLNPDFSLAWEEWNKTRKGKSKLTEHALALNLAELNRLSGGDVTTATKIVNQTIRNGWRGFFPLKEEINGTDRKNHGADHRESKRAREHGEHLSL